MPFKDKLLNKILRKAKKEIRKRKKKPVVPSGWFGINYYLCKQLKTEFSGKLHKDKMDELIRLSEVKIENKTPYDKRRQAKHRADGFCWVCGINKAYCLHHIIQLQNGGFDNGINRIPICYSCHSLVHPHLKDKNDLQGSK